VGSTDAAARRFWEHRHVHRTVVIVDDHAEFRAAARALLESEGFDIVGEAADAAEAVAVVARLRPQVVLLDIQLPDRDGFAVAKELGEGLDVVLTSSRDARAYGRRLEAASVRGFIAKRELSGRALAALVV
jgi:DNA-binding NarL/FixJ family response regulator